MVKQSLARRASHVAAFAWLVILVAGCVAAPPVTDGRATAVATPQPGSTAISPTRYAAGSTATGPGSVAAGRPGCAPAVPPEATPAPTVLPVYSIAATPNPAEPQVMPNNLRVFGGLAGTHGIPATDGTTVAWADSTDCLQAARIRDGYDYRPIAQLPGSVVLAVSDEIVAWSATETGPTCPPDCPQYISAIDIASRTAFPLSKTHYSEYMPRLSGSWLVWLAEDPLPGSPPTAAESQRQGQMVRFTLLARNLQTPADPIVLRQTTNNITYLTIEGERVVWAEQQEPAGGQSAVGLFARQLPNGPVEPLAPGQEIGPTVHDLRGDLLLYSDKDQSGVSFWAVNLRTGWRKYFSTGGIPTTDGRYIFWVSSAFSVSRKYRQDILGYDTASGTEFPLVSNAGVNDYPMTRSGSVIWLHHEGSLNFVSQVYAAAIAW